MAHRSESTDVDSAGVYFISVEEFEGRPVERPRADGGSPPSSEPEQREAPEEGSGD